MKKTILKNLIFVVAMIVSLLAIWFLSALIIGNEFILPQPQLVFGELTTIFSNAKFYKAIFNTIWRSVVAFIVSLVVAFLLAISVNLWKVRKPVNAVVTLLRAMPTISIIFLCLVAFDSDVISIIVSALVAFPVIYVAFDSAIAGDGKLQQMCDVFCVSKAKRVRFVYLPLLKEQIYLQSRASLPLCVKIAIAGEALAMPFSGIGREMYVAKNSYDMALLFAWTMVALVCCYLLEFLVWGVATLCKKVGAK